MKNLIIVSLTIFGIFCPLQAQVKTIILKEKPALPKEQQVIIFNGKEELTGNYEELAKIRVGDVNARAHCDSIKMIALMKKESRKLGGNAVLITDHKRPDFWNNGYCHQFEGTVLNIFNLEPIIEPNIEQEETILSGNRILPRLTFSINIGPAWKDGEIPNNIDRYLRNLYENLKSGTQLNISGDYFFTDNYGIRLGYQRFWSNANVMNALDGKFVMNAVYPAFVARMSTNNQKWLFDVSAGIGYVDYLERLENNDNYIEFTGSNVCFHFTLGAQYLITKNFGIGISLTGTGASLSKVKVNENGQTYTETLDDDTIVSLSQTGLLFGIKYHIR